MDQTQPSVLLICALLTSMLKKASRASSSESISAAATVQSPVEGLAVIRLVVSSP